jgi:hypothetical protein
MTEDRYRLVKDVVLVGFLIGALWFVGAYSQQAQNGRFIQYDPSKEHFSAGPTYGQDPNWRVIDTRTGDIKRVGP